MAKAEVPHKTLEDVVVLSLDADVVTLAAASATPPGTRVRFELRVGDSPVPLEMRGKVVTVKRQAEAGVAIRVKLVDSSKQTLDILAAMAACR